MPRLRARGRPRVAGVPRRPSADRDARAADGSVGALLGRGSVRRHRGERCRHSEIRVESWPPQSTRTRTIPAATSSRLRRRRDLPASRADAVAQREPEAVAGVCMRKGPVWNRRRRGTRRADPIPKPRRRRAACRRVARGNSRVVRVVDRDRMVRVVCAAAECLAKNHLAAQVVERANARAHDRRQILAAREDRSAEALVPLDAGLVRSRSHGRPDKRQAARAIACTRASPRPPRSPRRCRSRSMRSPRVSASHSGACSGCAASSVMW